MAGRQTGGRFRAALFLIVSMVAASVAVVVIWSVISSYQNELIEAQEGLNQTERIIVAAHDVAQGRAIQDEDLEEIELPPDYVPNGVLRDRTEAIGRTPRERILKREFIREERLANMEAGVGLNALIPINMRALTIDISGGASVSGFLNPGNYVDVLVTVTGGQTRATETNTLLQAVQVLAVTTNVVESDQATRSRGKPAVTLQVNPEDAQKLAHAISEGILTLTLRNDIDVTEIETHGAFSDSFLGKDSTKVATIKGVEWTQKVQSQDGSMTMIRGTEERKVSTQP